LLTTTPPLDCGYQIIEIIDKDVDLVGGFKLSDFLKVDSTDGLNKLLVLKSDQDVHARTYLDVKLGMTTSLHGLTFVSTSFKVTITESCNHCPITLNWADPSITVPQITYILDDHQELLAYTGSIDDTTTFSYCSLKYELKTLDGSNVYVPSASPFVKNVPTNGQFEI